ncbi:FecR family protein [Chitinophaga sancti]|uniref:FecR family protein n=1 Tax=Chitinophaga sancti TaxID=1004 RepID=A0A1K1MQX8_9BACT|nr:FecR family protein [Chitinophaga sancti]WQD62908.1 FecR family protein [Chitinophaga sancti]WQG91468.1 FecR family protein [Chitinophaga sancti]SFW25491.1 FecR family protein [Chitinophaga sancti]
MQPNSLLLRVLYKSWSQQALSPEESQALQAWLSADTRNQQVLTEIISGQWPHHDLQYYHQVSPDEQWARVQQKIQSQRRPVRKIRYQWAAAAAIATLLISGTTFYWSHHQHPAAFIKPTIQLTDILPGKQGAILTLANGDQVVLDSLANGQVSGTNATLHKGQLNYEGAGNSTAFNTMTTPKGRQFTVILPDGSKVWLNAQSSLRYPTAFTSPERRVDICGEAYFEIAPNASQPFFVNIPGKAEIAVLGTSFNINAYTDESAINTTLVDGAVKIQNTLLRPGQTAQLTTTLTIVNADVEKITAWKNGIFNFEGESLRGIMRQLERWYDIEVVYAPNVPDIVFGGKMSRDVSLAGLLRGLEATGVHFRLEGERRLVVYK